MDNSSGFFEKIKKLFTETKDYTKEYNPQDISKNKAISAIAYLGILFFLPLVVSPESRFGRFHANQSALLFIFFIAGSMLLRIFEFMLFWFGFLVNIISVIYGLVAFILFILGLINAIDGKAKELPLIGGLRLF